MTSATEFWQKLATRSRSNLYFAWSSCPRAQREAFRNVYRFLRAADDVADSGRPVDEIRPQLAAWRREIEHVYAGRAQHPIALRLAAPSRPTACRAGTSTPSSTPSRRTWPATASPPSTISSAGARR
jgi:phytoene synthase